MWAKSVRGSNSQAPTRAAQSSHSLGVAQLSPDSLQPRASPSLQGQLGFMATIAAPARHDLKVIKSFIVSLVPR